MANALDYLDWRGDLSFKASPFNDVDMFICSQLSAPDYSGIIPDDGSSVSIGDVADMYFAGHTEDVSNLGVLQSKYVLPMLKRLPSYERFKNIRLSNAVNNVDQENTEQFAAVTVELPDGTVCISIRGTDDTIIAWKEDFNLATKVSVPAQVDALNYLKKIASARRGKIRICGHSKGGNLAVYAAVNAPKRIRNRIISCFSFDGPGFNPPFLGSRKYLESRDKVITVMSQNSLVGTLLEPAGEVMYVISDKTGPMAHDGFSWQVMGAAFEKGQGLSDASRNFDLAMTDTLNSMTNDEKQAFVDELFDSLMSTGAVTITDLTDFKISSAIDMAKSFHGDKRVHKFVLSVAEQFIRSYAPPKLKNVKGKDDGALD